MGAIDSRDMTSISREVVRVFEGAWGIDEPIELIGNVENCVYRVGDGFVARATENHRRGVGELRAELDWITFLAQRGLPVASPIRSHNGVAIEVGLGNELAICLFERAPGEAFDQDRHWTAVR